jgi:hypothetical protein
MIMRAPFCLLSVTQVDAITTQDELNTDPAPKIFLQNKLNRVQLKLTELEYVLLPKGTIIETYLICD